MEDLKNSIKQAVTKRIGSPLFGFITLSWISTNWDNILTLMFSKEPIEKTIYIILNLEENYYLKRLILPIIIGTLMTITYPYLQLAVEWIHGKARKIRNKNNTAIEVERYNNSIDISKIKAKADIADERAKIDEENALQLEIEIGKTGIELEKEKQKRSQLNIDQLENTYTTLKKDNDELTRKSFKVEKSLNSMIIKCGDIINLIDEFNRTDNSKSLNDLKDKIKSSIGYDINNARKYSELYKKMDRITNNKKGINRIDFDYSTDNGVVSIKDNEDVFSLKFSKADKYSIHFYTNGEIKKIARVKDAKINEEISFDDYDSSSDHYTIKSDEVFLALHSSGKVIAGRITDIKDDSRGDTNDNVGFDYRTFEINEPIVAP
ncbi:hypothetical protein [Pectobacterium odoriferum]|uniref:hypothetical protein n=1 Tax=Pectobacterium odoriferum TaxID=78398 RepID=UPI000CD27961|nr:hypothetical protein [Pectobacterium odoriferum]POD90710.1 hypothetical protein BVY06_22975 [Pectobacterium odoriferum]POE36056.1 hypothetical protein BV920_22645 [Pectobacterium odoriferum]